jgi:hypothetical protein
MRENRIIYNIDPFPLRDGQVSWLVSGSIAHIQLHDAEAHGEAHRNVENLIQAEGYVDLREVCEVRVVPGGGVPVTQEGRDTARRDTQNTDQDDGAAGQFEFNFGFELVMNNGLAVSLQAHDQATRDEWINRLSDLVKYWKTRTLEDVCTMKRVRQHNLELLDIDQWQECVVGQFAQKWEVLRAVASPELFNLCGISNCRAIKVRII